MTALPEEASKAWDNRKSPVVLTTIDKNGNPNSIYATCASKYNEETIVVANNKFVKTLENILSGSKGSILFITEELKSYQIKGELEYHESGDIFDNMKEWNPQRLPGYGAAALIVKEVFTGAEKLL